MGPARLTPAKRRPARRPAGKPRPKRRPATAASRLRQAQRWLRRAGVVALRLTAGAAAFALAMTVMVEVEPRLPTPRDFPIEGIDVSAYQGRIDWAVVKNAGVDFAWIKATEGGDWLDRRFHENWRRAGEAGVRRGAYHFWFACRPAIDQATWFLATVPRDPDALPPVLDMEWRDDVPTCRIRPPAETIHAEMRVWLTTVERATGKRPVIYTTVDFHRDRLAGAFTDYPIWIRSVAGHPSIRYGDRRWHFWQYTAEGEVAGVPERVDRNVFEGDRDDWRAFLEGQWTP